MDLSKIHHELPIDWTVWGAVEEIKTVLLDEEVSDSQIGIAYVGLQVISLLLMKNRNYGDSALNPLTIFASNITPLDKIHIRMDDKLSRLARGAGADAQEDTVFDLVGYGILEIIARWSE